MFSKRWLIDTAERTAATFCEVFVAGLVAGGTLDLSTARSAALAAVAAALAVIKSALATRSGSSDSASLVA